MVTTVYLLISLFTTSFPALFPFARLNFKGKSPGNEVSLFIQFSAIEITLSLSTRKAYDTLITMSGKKGGVPMLVGEPWPFFNRQSSIARQIRHGFSMRVHESAVNDAINDAQKGCSMQM